MTALISCAPQTNTATTEASEPGKSADSQSLSNDLAESFFQNRFEYDKMSGQIQLAKDGQAQFVIVKPADAPNPVIFAAEELKHYLDLITGADFQIVETAPDGACAIYLGDGPQARAAGIDVNDLKRDGYRIIARPKQIVIAGKDDNGERTDILFDVKGGPLRKDMTAAEAYRITGDAVWDFERGTLYGVYRFLEEAGVRWFFPGPKGEQAPRDANLSLRSFQTLEEPAYALRVIGRTYWWPGALKHRAYDIDTEEYAALGWHGRSNRLWLLRMRASSQWFAFNHRVPRHRWSYRFGETHPEYFTLQPDGSRNVERSAENIHGGQLCYSEEGVFEETMKDITAFFNGERCETRGIPAPPFERNKFSSGWYATAAYGDTFSLLPQDGYQGCHCPQCQAKAPKNPNMWNVHSNFIWPFVARVARETEKTFPGKMLFCLAYSGFTEIPEDVKPLPDNVVVGVCPHYLNKTFNLVKDKEYSDFMELISNLGKANNMPLLFWFHHLFHYHRKDHIGAPMMILHFYKKLFKDIAPYGRLVFIQQDPDQIQLDALTRYAVLKLLYNPDLDIDALIDDYVEKAYGPAAPVMNPLTRDLEAVSVAAGKAAREGSRLGVEGAVLWTKILTKEKTQAFRSQMDKALALAKGTPFEERTQLFSRFVIDRMIESRQAFMEATGLDGVNLEAGEAPLPRQLQAFEDRVTVINPEEFGFKPDAKRSHAKLVNDSASVIGRAAAVYPEKVEHERKNEYFVTKTNPFHFGVYAVAARKTIKQASIPYEAFTGPGYHLFKLEDVTMTAEPKLYLYWSWSVQVPLQGMTEKGKSYDIYVSTRVDGPGYPHGDPESINALYVDRIFLVKRSHP